jgi:hypothetical protein
LSLLTEELKTIPPSDQPGLKIKTEANYSPDRKAAYDPPNQWHQYRLKNAAIEYPSNTSQNEFINPTELTFPAFVVATRQSRHLLF